MLSTPDSYISIRITVIFVFRGITINQIATTIDKLVEFLLIQTNLFIRFPSILNLRNSAGAILFSASVISLFFFSLLKTKISPSLSLFPPIHGRLGLSSSSSSTSSSHSPIPSNFSSIWSDFCNDLTDLMISKTTFLVRPLRILFERERRKEGSSEGVSERWSSEGRRGGGGVVIHGAFGILTRGGGSVVDGD